MIQRIQSIYLLLAAIAIAATFFLPLATASGDATVLATAGDNYFSDGKYWTNELPGFNLELGLAILVLVIIFRYKDRPKQAFSVNMAMLLLAVFLVMLGALGFYYAQRLPAGTAAQFGFGAATWPIAMVFLWLASRAIRKDEALVRSSDRLR